MTAHPRPEYKHYRVAGPGEARIVTATSPAHARQIVAAGRVGYDGYEVRLATPKEIAAAKRRLAWGWTWFAAALLVVVFAWGAWQSLVIQGGLWGPPAPAPLTEEQCVETRKVLRDWGIDGVDEPQSVKADCNR